MPEFSELSNYLSGQIDLGEEKVFLDEPWSLKSTVPSAAPVLSTVSSNPPAAFSPRTAQVFTPKISVVPKPSEPSSRPVPSQGLPSAPRIVIPESAKSKHLSAYDSAGTLAEFYEAIAEEKFYAGAKVSQGEGNLESPRLLLVVYAPTEKYLENGYAASDVGEMVVKMFESLKISKGEIGLSYFCKKSVSRAVLPQVAMACKKMLEKEVSLIHPQTIIFFGDKLLRQALSQNAKAVDFGGTPLEFAHVPATALIDPEEMLGNKQLKWITWKMHLPKCGFFG